MPTPDAGCQSWHANQMARYDLLGGLAPPASGHTHNDPRQPNIDLPAPVTTV